jgi:hypothetical protein
MAWEAAQPGADPRRALYARMILDHRLTARDPLQPAEQVWEQAATDILLSGREAPIAEIAGLLEA